MCLPFLPVPHVTHFPSYKMINIFSLEIFTVVILFHASPCAKPVLSLALSIPAGVSRLVPAQLNFIMEGLHLQNSQIMCLKHTQQWSLLRRKLLIYLALPSIWGHVFLVWQGIFFVAHVKLSTKGKGRSVEGMGVVSLTSSNSKEFVHSDFVDQTFW